MKLLLFFSDICIPFIIFFVVFTGLLKKQPVYDQFVAGAKDGVKIVASILPTLVGLFLSVTVLRASGFFELLEGALRPVTSLFSFPEQLVGLTTVKLFSSSAATGLLLDIFERFGPDSLIGRIASIELSCTETLFYTMSVYFLATRVDGHEPVQKSRYTIPGALFATGVGVFMSVLMANLM